MVNSLEGTCMFVYECINSNGRHIGMCVDAFMFGSCCAHNLTADQLAMLPNSSEPAVLFTQPGGGGVSQRPQRPHGQRPYRPSQVIVRPNVAADADGPAASPVDKKYHYQPAPSSSSSSSTSEPTKPNPSHVHRVPSTNFISNNRPNFLSRPAAQPYYTTTMATTTTTTTTTGGRPSAHEVDDDENKVDSVWSQRSVPTAGANAYFTTYLIRSSRDHR